MRCKYTYSVNYFTVFDLEVKLKIQKKYSKVLPDGPDHWSHWLKFMGILITISKMQVADFSLIHSVDFKTCLTILGLKV